MKRVRIRIVVWLQINCNIYIGCGGKPSYFFRIRRGRHPYIAIDMLYCWLDYYKF